MAQADTGNPSPSARPGAAAYPVIRPISTLEPAPVRRAAPVAERSQARATGPGTSDTASPDEVRGRLTRKPVRMVSAGKSLGDLQGSLEAALGVRVILASGAGAVTVSGEIAGDDGLGFLRALAARARLEWAFGLDGVFLAPEGSSRPTSFSTPSPEVASRAAALANREFESLGSGIRVVARKEEITVTAIPAWTNEVASLRVPGLVDAVARNMAEGYPSVGETQSGPAEPLTLMVFRLNNAFVDDKRLTVGSTAVLIPGVATLFRELTGLRGGALEASVTTRNSGVTRVPRMDPLAGSRAPRRDENGYDDAARRQPALRGRSARRDEGDLDVDAPPQGRQAANPNEPIVIADSRMNTLMVRDRAGMRETYTELIKALDKTAEMVQLDAFIIDVKASRLDEFGIGFSWSGSGILNSSIAIASPLRGSPNVIFQGVRGMQLLAQIRALESRGDSEILTVPSVVTLNNLEATFSAKQSFYVRVAGNQDTSLNEVTAETLLKVTPLVAQDGEAGTGLNRRIRLLINVQDATLDASASAVVDSLPRTFTNQISTQALVRGGDTLVIGGQVIRKQITNVSGLPLVSKIPLLGALTSSRAEDYEQYVRIYIVRPSILNVGSSSQDVSMGAEQVAPPVSAVAPPVATTPPVAVAPPVAATPPATVVHPVAATSMAAAAVPAPPPTVTSGSAPAPVTVAPTDAVPEVSRPSANPAGNATPLEPPSRVEPVVAAPPALEQEGVTTKKSSSRAVAPRMGTHFVQIGVYDTVKRTEDVRATVNQAGFQVHAWQSKPGKPTRVHAGPFATLEAAENALVRLKELGKSGGFKPGPIWSRATPLPIAAATESVADTAETASEGSEADGPGARSSKRYFLQVGVFQKGARVQQLRVKADESGLRTFAWPMKSGNFVRLHAGPFANVDAADTARARLEEIGQSLGFTPGPVWSR